VLYESPVELQIDSVINRVFRMLDEHQLKRVVVDSLGDLATAASDPQRLHDYMYALMQHFVIHRTTCIVTAEATLGDASSATGLHGLFSYMSDNVVRITATITDRIRRSVCVTKTRGSAHDLDVRGLELTGAGARVV
jgi:circadian clock protein KaiC